MSQTEGFSVAKCGKLKLKNESKSSHKKHKKSKQEKKVGGGEGRAAGGRVEPCRRLAGGIV